MQRPRPWLERYNDLQVLIEEEIMDLHLNGNPDYATRREIALGQIFSRLLEGEGNKLVLDALGRGLEDQNSHGAAYKIWNMTGRVKGPCPVPDTVNVEAGTRGVNTEGASFR